jgi:hypothetical protein
MELVYGIQGNEDANATAREGSIKTFLGPKPATSVSPGLVGLVIRECLKESTPNIGCDTGYGAIEPFH